MKKAFFLLLHILFSSIIFGQCTITDIDGNVYNTVKIGSQLWMAQNLRTTRYNDGTTIPNVTNTNTWINLTTDARCTLNNVSEIDSIVIIGRLYNWYAVNTGKICPTGCHVPSDAEWTTLQNYLIANGYNYDGSTTGNLIAKSLASTIDWEFNPTTGNVGNNQSSNNKSGFNAYPSGSLNTFGDFGYKGTGAGWWSSTANGTSNADYWSINSYLSKLYKYNYSHVYGFSVRCLIDNSPCDTLTLQLKTNKASICLGESATLTARVKGNNAPFKFVWSCGEKNDSVVTVHPTVTAKYKITVSDAQGFIRVDSIFITVKQPSSSVIKATICQGERYLLKDTFFYKAGLYTMQLTNFEGCDSLVKLDLKVIQCSKPNCHDVDVDGNTYKTVNIGTQTWFAENLKTTKYNDGTFIPNISNNTDWTNLKTGAYCNYNNEISNGNTYGNLYNWYAVNTGKLCPTGWHVPSYDEWNALDDYLIANGYNYDSTYSYSSTAKSLASTSMWQLDYSSDLGNIGNILLKNNKTGFNALPSGGRINTFFGIGQECYWWNSDIYKQQVGWESLAWGLNYGSNGLIIVDGSKNFGYSVRCIRNIYVSSPIINLPSDTLLCTGKPLFINVSLLGTNKYLWQDNSTSSQYSISKGGTYSVSVTDTNNCSASKIMNVQELASPAFLFPNDTITCDEILLPINVSCTECNYLWNDGSVASKYIIQHEGEYSVTVSNNCGIVKDSIHVKINDCTSFLDVPTAFSPNGDGLNDILYAVGRNIGNIVFDIYDRWGQKVFESNSLADGWDGTFKGRRLESATFMFTISATGKNKGNEIIKKGNLALIR